MKIYAAKHGYKIYDGMILPYFDHGDMVYMGTKQELLNKLQVQQNRALQICLKVDKLHPTQDILAST